MFCSTFSKVVGLEFGIELILDNKKVFFNESSTVRCIFKQEFIFPVAFLFVVQLRTI